MRTDIEREQKKLKYNRKKLADNLDRLGDDIGDGWATFKANVKETLKEVDEDLEEINREF